MNEAISLAAGSPDRPYMDSSSIASKLLMVNVARLRTYIRPLKSTANRDLYQIKISAPAKPTLL